jgi:zinc/manganese transport system substrate-binding protein
MRSRRWRREVRAAVAAIPPARRKVITSHEAFGYFARAYGLAFIAPQGVSTDAEPSAQDVARIIRQIRRERIPAVFLENVSDPRLMERIARESGARIGGRLYADALTPPDGPAGTYIDLMRHNIRALGAALSS